MKTTNANKIKDPTSDKVFYAINYVLLAIVLIVVFYPCYFVVIASFSDPAAVNSGRMLIWPEGFNTLGYQKVLFDPKLWMAYANTILYTVGGTVMGVVFVLLAGYALSRSDMPFRNILMGIFVFTMYFGGGLIPFYLLICDLHLINTRFLMIILGTVSVYNIIIARSFFASSIPKELQEAASIDGCGNGKFFTSIVIPLSKPIIAVISLYIAVGKWNEYFNALIYLSDEDKQPLQIFLRKALTSVSVADQGSAMDQAAQEALLTMAEVLKYAIIVVATVPILTVYPFIQKYFAKGVMIGSIKG